MTRLLPTLGLLAVLSVPAVAQVATDPAKLEPGAYALEPNHTRVIFSVSHFGFTKYAGEFRGISGTLSLDPNHPDASKVDVRIATDSVLVPNDKLKSELVGAEWLDAAKFPEITFRSTRVVKTGPDTADVTGDFTLHGVTKPLTLKVKFNAAGVNPADKAYTAGFEATGTLTRTEFGVKTYAPYIGDEVTIDFAAPFEKAK